MIEAPLLGPNEQEYKTSRRNVPKAYAQWQNAELQSDRASEPQFYAKLERLVTPLSKVSNRNALDNVWKQIKLVLIVFTYNLSILTHWNLELRSRL